MIALLIRDGFAISCLNIGVFAEAQATANTTSGYVFTNREMLPSNALLLVTSFIERLAPDSVRPGIAKMSVRPAGRLVESKPSAARQIQSCACVFPATASDRKRGAAPERVRKYRQTQLVYRALWKSVRRWSQAITSFRNHPPCDRCTRQSQTGANQH